MCSRMPVDEESGQYCPGQAKQFHGKDELVPFIPHGEWCKVVEDEEKVGRICWRS